MLTVKHGDSTVSAALAKVDDMLERCERLAKRSLPPIKPDMSLPRRLAREPVAQARAVQPSVHDRSAHTPVSWEPQERFERIRRAGGGYKPLCGYGYGEDVDRAFDECSNAPV